MGKFKAGLLLKVVIAIITGSLLGLIAPEWLSRLSSTITSLFGNFLDFIIPLIILGLVAPGISDLGKGAGKLLLLTVGIAYGSTLFSGFMTYAVSYSTFPVLLKGQTGVLAIEPAKDFAPFFTIDIPPVISVMSALVLAFIIGIAAAGIKGTVIKGAMEEFRIIIGKVINSAIIPVLPIYILCIFLNISSSGQISDILSVFLLIILVIFILHIALLIIYFSAAAAVAGGNPFTYLRTMLPAYFTALGTQSSAATIPVTLQQTIRNGVNEDIAGFVIPLCATIHLSGSMMKITACAVAIMLITGTMVPLATMAGFILTLGVAMIAAPGVPGGAIMAAIAVLSSILGFDQSQIGLMIALYIAMDSFGTACNVTGDGAIAIVINKLYKKKTPSGV